MGHSCVLLDTIQILFFVFTLVLVIETCKSHTRPVPWLAVLTGFNEVLKVGDILKSKVILQAEFSTAFGFSQQSSENDGFTAKPLTRAKTIPQVNY